MKIDRFLINSGKTIFPSLFIILMTATSFRMDDACKSFYPMQEGKKFELTHYNAKDKMQSRVEYEVIEKSESGSTVSATIKMQGYDKKGKAVFGGDFKVYCEGGVFKVDVEGMLKGQMQQLEAMQDAEVSVETQDLELPSGMSVGDELKDGSITVSMAAVAAGMPVMSFTTNIKDRKVVAEEEITTPAGSFDCIVITSVVESKTGFVNISYETKEWLAENIGIVRSETYRDGKLEGYALLTSFK